MTNNDSSYIGFNQNKNCVTVSLHDHFEIFRVAPLNKVYSSPTGHYGIIEMNGMSSLIAVVGNGEDPSYSTRHLRLINLVDSSEICRLTFVNSIKTVNMNQSRLVVGLEDEIYIYNLLDMTLLHKISNLQNYNGVFHISYNEKENILAYPIDTYEDQTGIRCNYPYVTSDLPDTSRSQSKIKSVSSSPGERSDLLLSESNNQEIGDDIDYTIEGSELQTFQNTKISGDVAIFDMNSLQPRMIVEAHKSGIRAVALSKNGTLLATASKLGTIIRIFDISSGEKVIQFRRGRYPSKIKCISFSDDNKYLIVNSSSFKIHIFEINQATSVISGSYDPIIPPDSFREAELATNDFNSLQDMEEDRNLEEEDFVLLNKRQEAIKYPRNIGDLLKSSSKTLSKEATRQFKKYFTNQTSNKLEPKRNIAYCIIPGDISTSGSLVAIGDLEKVNRKEYPELFQYKNVEIGCEQEFVTVRRVYFINTDGYLLIYMFDPKKRGQCFLVAKLSLLSID